MPRNMVFFDLGAHRTDEWQRWMDWFMDREPDCLSPYLTCHNNHSPETCDRRAKLEGNPFTRPIRQRLES